MRRKEGTSLSESEKDRPSNLSFRTNGSSNLYGTSSYSFISILSHHGRVRERPWDHTIQRTTLGPTVYPTTRIWESLRLPSSIHPKKSEVFSSHRPRLGRPTDLTFLPTPSLPSSLSSSLSLSSRQKYEDSRTLPHEGLDGIRGGDFISVPTHLFPTSDRRVWERETGGEGRDISPGPTSEELPGRVTRRRTEVVASVDVHSQNVHSPNPSPSVVHLETERETPDWETKSQ